MANMKGFMLSSSPLVVHFFNQFYDGGRKKFFFYQRLGSISSGVVSKKPGFGAGLFKSAVPA